MKATALGILLSILVFPIIGSDIARDTRRKGAVLNDGNLDPTFGVGGKVRTDIQGDFDNIRAVAIQGDGKIVVAGSAYNGTNIDFAVLRYNTNGTLDASFDGDGRVITPVSNGDDLANGVAIQPDGKIVAAGFATTFGTDDFAVVRYNADGSPDTTFDADGKATFNISPTFDDIATSVAVQPDGNIIVGGFSNNGSDDDFTVIRLTDAGALDPTFNVIGISTFPVQSGDDAANAVAIQSDGKIVVAGYTETGNEKDFGVARLTSTGLLDLSFDIDGRVASSIKVGDDIANSVAIQLDGKIVAAGFARDSGPDSDFAAVRYNTDGSLDNSFDTDGRVIATVASPNDIGRSVALQPDGKIVIAGETDNGSDLDFGVVRLNTDGSLDLTFDLDGKVIIDFQNSSDTAYGAAIQLDGRIVVVGDSDISSVHDIGLLRLGSVTGGQPRYIAPGGTDVANDCLSSSNPCGTIAHVILLAAPGDTVSLSAGTYTESGLIVDKDLTFTGSGSGTTIIQAGAFRNSVATDRVFSINSGVTVFMSDLTIQNGQAPDGTTGADCTSLPCLPASNGGVGGAGGGILNNGTLTLTNMVLSGNRAGKGGTAGNISCPVGACNNIGGEGGTGGGVYSTGSLTVSSSTFTDNHAGEPGDAAATIGCGSCSSNPGDTGNGGALSGNTVSVDSSTFTENSADDGGAILQGATAITITKSTFAENSASNTGGAINCNGPLPGQNCSISESAIYDNFTSGTQGGTVAFFGLSTKNISNTTITGNDSLGDAGGILANAGTVNITFVTIANNIADANNSTTGDGGGIRNEAATVNLKNSIIVDNSDDGGEAPQISGAITSLGYNHVESTTGGVFTPTAGDVIGSENGLGPLANNGGPTLTRGLFANSEALDQIPNGTNGCGVAPFNIDQRGVARPADGLCDKGAFEGNLGAAPQEIDVTGLAVSIPDLDTTPSALDDTDFGPTDITGGTVVHTFTIHNSGTSDLVVSNPIITGANPLDFSVTAPPTSPVAPGGTTTFEVTFDPNLLGLRTAVVNIVNNDLNENPYHFSISGIGAVPTAATVSLSGRVRTSGGVGISNAILTLVGQDGSTRISRSTSFGYFYFDDVPAGATYFLSVKHKRFTFNQPGILISVLDEITGLDFVADSSGVERK
ncbi:MAG: hypothetical protein DMF63_04585 [Acidobacteria bacterium]|nr:MAG: hypothetical protein DMF63_04585 [Acidobacteriota bacterium]